MSAFDDPNDAANYFAFAKQSVIDRDKVTLGANLHYGRGSLQIEVARALLDSAAKEKMDEVTDDLNRLEEENVGLIIAEIHQHPLNFSVFMKSPDAAAAFALIEEEDRALG